MCLAGLGAVLVDVALEIGDAGVRAGDQHFGDADQGVAHGAEELMLGPTCPLPPYQSFGSSPGLKVT